MQGPEDKNGRSVHKSPLGKKLRGIPSSRSRRYVAVDRCAHRVAQQQHIVTRRYDGLLALRGALPEEANQRLGVVSALTP